MKMNLKLLSLSLFAGTFMSMTGFGATVGAGTFSLSGSATGAIGGIDFYLIVSGDQLGSINLPTTGVFSDLAPTTKETIQNLTSANGVTPGTPFDFHNWVQLTDGINLDATSIPIPLFPVCPASGSVAIGYECLVNAHSPVVLTQTASGVTTALSIFGEAHYAGQTTYTPFNATFNSPTSDMAYDATIAAFTTYFDTHGEIPGVNYSASFTTVPVATPEPAAFWMASVGLLCFGLFRGKRATR
jgi:hypothetical protein